MRSRRTRNCKGWKLRGKKENNGRSRDIIFAADCAVVYQQRLSSPSLYSLSERSRLNATVGSFRTTTFPGGSTKVSPTWRIRLATSVVCKPAWSGCVAMIHIAVMREDIEHAKKAAGRCKVCSEDLQGVDERLLHGNSRRNSLRLGERRDMKEEYNTNR